MTCLLPPQHGCWHSHTHPCTQHPIHRARVLFQPRGLTPNRQRLFARLARCTPAVTGIYFFLPECRRRWWRCKVSLGEKNNNKKVVAGFRFCCRNLKRTIWHFAGGQKFAGLVLGSGCSQAAGAIVLQRCRFFLSVFLCLSVRPDSGLTESSLENQYNKSWRYDMTYAAMQWDSLYTFFPPFYNCIVPMGFLSHRKFG